MAGQRRAWKYLGEKFGIPLAIWIFTSIITQALRKYGGMSMIKLLFQTFVIELWPIWSGLLAVLVYLFVMLLIDTRKKIKDLTEEVNTLKMNRPDWVRDKPIEDDKRTKMEWEILKRICTG